jgi:hypothetical protein
MDKIIKQPDSLIHEGNLDHNWTQFKQRFMLYLTAIDGEKYSKARKVALLLTIAGQSAVDIYNSLPLTDNDKNERVVAAFDEYCSPKKNETYERYLFRSRQQHQDETFEQFVTDLRLKAKTCNFANLYSSMIRDQIVFGIRDSRIREKLLRENDLTLDQAVHICQSAEAAHKQVKIFSQENKGKVQTQTEDDVNYVQARGKTFSKNNKPKQRSMTSRNCFRCGMVHKYKDYPAYGKNCNKCGLMNHFEKVCKTNIGRKKEINNVDEDIQIDDLFVGSVDSAEFADSSMVNDDVMSGDSDVMSDNSDVNQVNVSLWTVPLVINNVIIPILLDTGAKVNLITIADFKNLPVKPKIFKKTCKDYCIQWYSN